MSTSLLNWDNHIVYDGLMMHKGALQKDVLKRALQAYTKVQSTACLMQVLTI